MGRMEAVEMRLKQIGERVRLARSAKNMSQAQLAAAVSVSTPYISNIEQGKQTMSITTLSGICEALEISADWLLRNRSPESQRITDTEIMQMLSDCTPEEKEALLRLIPSIKDALRSVRSSG